MKRITRGRKRARHAECADGGEVKQKLRVMTDALALEVSRAADSPRDSVAVMRN